MKYTCVDPVEFLYPDITEYKSGTDKISILTPRGSYACAQIMLTEGNGSVEVSCDGWNPEVYEMVAIPVEESDFGWADPDAPHTPERKGPFEVYDCLKPYSESVAFQDGVAAVYFSMWIPQDAAVGTINGTIKVGEISIPVTIEVSSAVVPEETLDVAMLYVEGNVRKFHNVQSGSEEFEQFENAYLTMLRRMRQTVFWMPENSEFPIRTALDDGRYAFDFSKMEAYINKVMSLGYKKIYHRLGYRASWGKSTILVNNLPSTSYEGYCFLAQYLSALHQFLEEHGWIDKYLLSICDEPDEVMGMEYRALCNVIRKFAPGIKLIDPTHFGAVEGSIDICIPGSSDYDKHMDEYESYRKYGDTLWYYDCMGPRGDGYINRFLDYTLIATRYHGWGNFAHDLKGYLHWAANHYQPNQDPFKQSVPLHSNAGGDPGKIPPGDTHIMYPGEDGPWMSVRMENYRAGFEEYEMLRTVAAEDKELADSICKKVFRRFNDVEYDPLIFRAVRNELIRAMEKIEVL